MGIQEIMIIPNRSDAKTEKGRGYMCGAPWQYFMVHPVCITFSLPQVSSTLVPRHIQIDSGLVRGQSGFEVYF